MMTKEGIQTQQYKPCPPCPEFTPFSKKCQKELTAGVSPSGDGKPMKSMIQNNIKKRYETLSLDFRFLDRPSEVVFIGGLEAKFEELQIESHS
jgi:hypothetical protein